MKNIKIKAATACLALCLSPMVFAQTTGFAGWSLGLNAESAKTTTSPLNAASDSGTSTSLSLQPQYTWVIGDNFVLGTGLTIGVGDNKAGVFSSGTQDTAIRSRLSFDLQPGYVFSNSLLGYVKLSSSGATFEVTSPGQPSVSTTVSGAGYGIGLRAVVSKNWYAQAEYDTVKYNRVLGAALWDIGVDANVFSLGFGLKF